MTTPRTDPALVWGIAILVIVFVLALLIQAYPDVLAPLPPGSR